MAGRTCPCCGSPIPEFMGIAFDDGMRTASLHGQTITLTNMEAALLRYLLDKKGRLAARDDIYNWLYQLREDTTDGTVDVWMCKLRKKLRLLGVEVRNVHGSGFCLASQSEPPSAA